MKTRILFIFLITSVLFLFLTLTVVAQGSTIEGSSQVIPPDKESGRFVSDLSQIHQNGIVLGYTSEITYTPAVTIYLPIVLKDYAGCYTIPTLLSPAIGSTLSTINPLFSWDSGNDPTATAFRMQVALDVDFTQIRSDLWSGGATGIEEFRFASNYNSATIYYWRAWLMCGETQGQYSEVWSFTTGSGGTILPAPTLIAPDNGSTVPTTTVTLQWAIVPDALEYIVHWRQDGWGGYYYQWVNDTQYSIHLLNNTTYEWWVTARNDYALGTNSATWHFTTPVGSSAVSPQDFLHSFVIEERDARITFER
jgi:hypothetical protein